MELVELPVPPHFRVDFVSSIWRVNYAERMSDATSWARRFGVRPSSSDTFKTCLLLIDVQNTFCIPDYELFVGGMTGYGAVEDNVRLCQFIYKNICNITQIVATLDTHQIFQIFHSVFLTDEQGNHPPPYSVIRAHDVRQGKWRIDPEACRILGLSQEYAQSYLRHYVEKLESSGRYSLTIWPFHALLGSIGHALVPAVEEAIFFHSIARSSQPLLRIKGNLPLTEHYSAFRTEVMTGPQGESIGTFDTALLDYLLKFDAIIVAGQAKSHCVAWTVEDLRNHIKDHHPEKMKSIYLLDDCSSPVVVPGVVDYSDEAERTYNSFRDSGMNIVKSITPMSTWQGPITSET